MISRVVVLAPTPAPYRAWEYDHLQTELGDRISFHLMFMERSWHDMQWAEDLPRVATWEVLPKVNLGALNRIPGLARINRGTWRRLNALRPSAVILHGWDAPALWSAYWWAKRNQVALLMRTDSNYLRELTRPAGLRTRLRAGLLRRFLERIDAFVTIGTANERYYQMYGADPARFFRASYMIDAKAFAERADQQRQRGQPLKAELRIRQRFVAAYVGRLIPLKGIDTIIKAFLNAGPRLADAALLLIGDGPLVQELRELAAPLEERVHFAGFKQSSELGDFYGIADVLVLPSYWEAWGMVVSEAFAAGLPVIASDQVGSVQDLIIPGETGDVIKAGDINGLTESLVRMFQGSPNSAEMGRAARLRFQDWVSKHNVVEGFREAIESAMRRRQTVS